ncbi:MAG TPA: YetF domain-containing protein [Casimicrobiaceae bacterium]|nr:YetF domain-containing protein [Casimicrobiaceae bacterium]
MDAVIRAAVIYLFLLLVFRIAGQRSIAHITTFDFVLLLVIGEATQGALLGEDHSMIGAMVVIVTLVGLDIALSLVKQRLPRVENLLEGTPVIIVDEGRVLKERIAKERIDESDIMTAAREKHGLERLDQIKYAVLERNGGISIIARPEAK